MVRKILTVVMMLIAIILAALAVVLPVSRQADVVMLIRFFDVMLPILGVGALFKYLCTSYGKEE